MSDPRQGQFVRGKGKFLGRMRRDGCVPGAPFAVLWKSLPPEVTEVEMWHREDDIGPKPKEPQDAK